MFNQYTWNFTTRNLQTSSLKKKYPDPTTPLTITALEKLNIFEKYKGCMLLTEGIADSEKESQEVTKRWGNTCKFQPCARGGQKTDSIRWALSTVWATGALSFSTGNQGDAIHI